MTEPNEQVPVDVDAAAIAALTPSTEQSQETPSPVETPEVEPQPAMTPQQQQQADWDAKQFALQYRGKQFLPKDKDHLISLAQQGFSYSQQMAALKQQEEQLKGKYGQYEQLDQMLTSNPALAKQVVDTITAFNQQGVAQPQRQQPTEQKYQLPPELLSEIEELRQFKGELKQQKAHAQVDQEINELRSKYKQVDWDQDEGQGTVLEQTLTHALNTNLPLALAFKDLMFDKQITQVKAEALKAQAEQRVKAVRSGVVPSGSAPAKPPVSGYRKGMSFDDVAAAALARLQQ